MRTLATFLFLALVCLNIAAEESMLDKALANRERHLAIALPAYPPEALRQGIVGKVEFEFGLSQQGFPKDVVILNSEPPSIFDEVVKNAITSWQLLPNLNKPCSVEPVRVRQQLFFEIQNGEPKISVSKSVDVPYVPPVANVNSASNTSADSAANGAAMVPGKKRLRAKAGTIAGPTYPIEARKKGVQGIVDANYVFSADGKVRDVEIIYSLPAGVFDEAVRNAVMQYQLEAVDGGPPDRTVKTCIKIEFKLTD